MDNDANLKHRRGRTTDRYPMMMTTTTTMRATGKVSPIRASATSASSRRVGAATTTTMTMRRSTIEGGARVTMLPRSHGRRASATIKAAVVPQQLFELGELEGNIQAFYLGTLLAILGGAGFIVVRQVLIRRELDDQAKRMGERIRAGNASAEDYFEMGSILLRKKVFTQAVRNLQAAAENWDGDEQDLALVHNALGFGYSNTDKIDAAIDEYKKSVALQPGYVTAWNNLGEAYEKKKEMKEAIRCYEESLELSPNNPTATERLEEIKMRLRRRGQLD